MTETAVATAVVVVFALVNGMNDGGTLVAFGLRAAARWPWLRVVALAAALAVGPWVVGTRVAETLTGQLVSFEGPDGGVAMLGAVIGTMVVIGGLSAAGLPTSLTLGLVGAIAGAGVATGLPVTWRAVGIVLVAAVVAPLLGLLGAMVLHRVVAVLHAVGPGVRRLLLPFGFGLQCLAYGANDGQKLLAVLAVAVGVGDRPGSVPLLGWGTVIVAFAVGTVLGVGRIGPTIDGKVLPLRTEQAWPAQLAGAAAVLATAGVGSPVSLIQATTGGLVGAGVSVTPRRVRWSAVAWIALAWVVTLPAGLAGGALAATLLRLVVS